MKKIVLMDDENLLMANRQKCLKVVNRQSKDFVMISLFTFIKKCQSQIYLMVK